MNSMMIKSFKQDTYFNMFRPINIKNHIKKYMLRFLFTNNQRSLIIAKIGMTEISTVDNKQKETLLKELFK